MTRKNLHQLGWTSSLLLPTAFCLCVFNTTWYKRTAYRRRSIRMIWGALAAEAAACRSAAKLSWIVGQGMAWLGGLLQTPALAISEHLTNNPKGSGLKAGDCSGLPGLTDWRNRW